MQKKFVSNLLFVLFLNILIKPFWILGIDVAVQNRVGASEYGLYYPLFGFAIMLNILLDFGITNYNNRTIAQHSSLLRRYFSGIFNLKLLLGILYMIITLIAALWIGYEHTAIQLLFVLGINQFLASLILYLRSNFAALHLFKLDGIFSVLDRVLMIIICGYLLWSPNWKDQFTISWFVYAQFVAFFITAFFAFIMVFRKAKFFQFSIDFKLFRIIIKESLPFALLVLLMSFYYRLDSVMVERLLVNGREEAGIYAQSYRLLEAFNMFAYLVAGLLLPIFSKMLKESKSIASLLRTAVTLLFIPSSLAAIIAFFNSEAIMDLLYIAHVEYSAKIFAILMISFVAIALTYAYGTLLTANGSLKVLNKIALTGLVCNLSLNFLLIPSQGAYGAAVATLITQLLVIGLQVISVNRILLFSIDYLFILKCCLLAIITFVSAKFLSAYELPWMINSILILFEGLLLAFVLQLLNLGEIKKLWALKD